MSQTPLDPADFRNAMSRFASGVTIVTTHGSDSRPVGFTASAFSSLSLNPPLALVCLDRNAECFDAFQAASHMAISILSRGQGDIAMRFATRGADKFGGLSVEAGKLTGLPLIPEAIAQVECEVRERLDGGDHVILVGQVLRALAADKQPLLHYLREFGRFQAD